MGRALPYAWYPLTMASAIAAFAALLAAGVPLALAAYAPVAASGVAVALLEWRSPERADWRPRRADVAADAAFMALVMVAWPRVLGGIAALALARSSHAAFASPLWPHAAPLAAQVLLMVLAVDLLRYWLHRACHAWTPLWRLHEVHHSPDLLYVVNVARFHPLEKALHFAVDTLPFLALGVAPEVLAGYLLVYSVNGLFQHSNVRLRYGWLNYVVGSAETHRWHHARDPREAACNFGSTTAAWDLAFGTWRLPGPAREVGIADRGYPKGFLAQMVVPFRARGARPRPALSARFVNALVTLRMCAVRAAAAHRLAPLLRDPMAAQRRVLGRILARNRDTAFGRRHGFARIATAEDYARAVPVAEFEALRPDVEADIAHDAHALTVESPVHYVRTSGTTGAPKDIPLTASHLRSLRRIQRESVAFQYRHHPEAFAGSIFAMVGHAFEGELANGMPYGAASGIVAQDTPALVRGKFVLPPEALALDDSRVKYLLALRLAIARADVTYVGAANPSTLLALAKLYREHHARLAADLRAGTFFLAARLPRDVMAAVRERLAADPLRASELESLHARSGCVRLADLWPALRLAVCWTRASAGVAVEALREELPRAASVMELGYVASEFRGTITLGRRAASGLPTIDTHFFEFAPREAWDAGCRETTTLSGLERGREYYVIVTTPSGLYRYFINDVVRVAGFLHATPLLAFVQKGKGVTSITGEKLCESQVLQAVRAALARAGRRACFVMMLADEAAQGYRLYVEAEGAAADARRFAADVDAGLAQLNCEYAAKRESGRLAPLAVRWLAAGAGEAYKRHCVGLGQREGQFKVVALDYLRRFAFDLEAHALAG